MLSALDLRYMRSLYGMDENFGIHGAWWTERSLFGSTVSTRGTWASSDTRVRRVDVNEVLEGCRFWLHRWVPDLVVSVDSIHPSKCRATVCPFLLAENNGGDHPVNPIASDYFNAPLSGGKVAS